jgi:hypothetical protein
MTHAGRGARMLRPMPRRSSGPGPDVFTTFADRVDDRAGSSPHGRRPPSAGVLARSAGATLGLMVLSALGFVGGAWLAARLVPEVSWVNPLWEGAAFLLWCGVGGLIGAGIALALGVVVVGLPWLRRQRGAGPTSTSAP